jgi:hypothetical protein
MRNPFDLLPKERREELRLAHDYAWATWDRWLFSRIRWAFSEESPTVTATLLFGDGGEIVTTGETCLEATQAMKARTGNFNTGWHSNPTHH